MTTKSVSSIYTWITYFKSAATAIVLAVLIASCAKAPEHANYIPKDANMVLSVDVKSLGLKSMDFKELLSLNNIKKTMSGEKAKDSSLLKLKDSGIDLLNTAYIFGKISDSEKGYGAAIIALTNKEKFETFVNGLDKKFTVTTEGAYKIATSDSNKNTGVAWSKDIAIFLYQSPNETASIKETALSILNLKQDQSLALNDKNFSALLKQSADISFWINFEKISKLASKYNPNATSLDLKDTYLTANCNFENGQVVINTKYHANKEFSEKLNLAKDNLGKEIVTVIPAKSLIGMFSAAIDMTKFYNYLEKEKLLSAVESQASVTTGMSPKDLFQVFNGEIVTTLNGIVMQEVKSLDPITNEEIIKQEPRPEFSVVLGINDKTKSTQLLNALVEKGLLQKQEHSYSILNLYHIIDKGNYIVVVPESLKQLTIDGTGEKLNSAQASLLTENSAALYVGMGNIPQESLTLFGPTIGDWIKKSPIESLTITSAPLKDQVSAGKCLISFKEKNQNSLITIAKLSDELATKSQEELVQPLPQALDSSATYLEEVPN